MTRDEAVTLVRAEKNPKKRYELKKKLYLYLYGTNKDLTNGENNPRHD